MPRPLLHVACLTLVALSLAACGDAYDAYNVPTVDTSNTLTMSLWEITQRVEAAPSFMVALRTTGADSTLMRTIPHTLFVPRNARMGVIGFRDTSSATSPANGSNPDATIDRSLETRVGLHLARGRILPENVADSQLVNTLANIPISLKRRSDTTFTVNDIRILRTIPAQNGVIHVISRALELPPPDTSGFLAPNS